MQQRLTAGCFFILLVFLLIGDVGAVAEADDPHELYEQKCGTCHESHGGEFVGKHLMRFESRVVGRQTGKELRSFLERGHGKLSSEEVDAMVLHLTSILDRGALYREKCLLCHDRAVLLARRRLIFQDGELIGRYSDRDMAEFLQNHGRLEKAEIDVILQMLKSQLRTQPEP